MGGVDGVGAMKQGPLVLLGFVRDSLPSYMGIITKHGILAGDFLKRFLFSPGSLGKYSNLTNIFQMGGSTTNSI